MSPWFCRQVQHLNICYVLRICPHVGNYGQNDHFYRIFYMTNFPAVGIDAQDLLCNYREHFDSSKIEHP